MFDDPIIKEIHRIRLQIEAECGNDPKNLHRHFMEAQEEYRDRLVCFQPKRIAPKQRVKKAA